MFSQHHKTLQMNIKVIKASGDTELFSSEKLERSLLRSGANDETVEEIVKDIESWLTDGVTTKKIYSRAFALLRRKKRTLAARYSLKRAIMELGPTGHPFEYLVGEVFKHFGYDIEVGQIIEGRCVTHEVDVLFTGNKEQGYVECKYYNSGGKFANVQVSLYIRSRVNDIIDKRKLLPEYCGFDFHGWVVTNTRFTGDAMSFGICSGLNLMSWDFPENNSLKGNVEKYNIFPITVLTELTKSEKSQLLDKGIVLCRQLKEHQNKLTRVVGDNEKKIKRIMMEVADLCYE